MCSAVALCSGDQSDLGCYGGLHLGRCKQHLPVREEPGVAFLSHGSSCGLPSEQKKLHSSSSAAEKDNSRCSNKAAVGFRGQQGKDAP